MIILCQEMPESCLDKSGTSHRDAPFTVFIARRLKLHRPCQFIYCMSLIGVLLRLAQQYLAHVGISINPNVRYVVFAKTV